MAKQNEKIVPKCMQMCPASECSLRKKQNLIHILETDSNDTGRKKMANPSKMIKTYCRSAAGQSLTNPELLRTPTILKDTINHIFTVLIHDKRVSKTAKYDFINDRLRSIKQDAVIQRLKAEDWFEILPPMIRFYVLSSYWLCEEPLTNFDQKLNKNQLLDCLLHFINNYEVSANQEYAELYAEIEALYLITNFEVEAISRAVALNLPQAIFQDTLNLILKWYNRNYVAVFRKLLKMSLLPACLFTAIHLNKIRKDTLKIMSVAYSSKNIYFPLSKLTTDLIYNSNDEAIADCVLYEINLTAGNSMIQFRKILFNDKNASPRKIRVLDNKLNAVSTTDLIFKNTIFQKPIVGLSK